MNTDDIVKLIINDFMKNTVEFQGEKQFAKIFIKIEKIQNEITNAINKLKSKKKLLEVTLFLFDFDEFRGLEEYKSFLKEDITNTNIMVESKEQLNTNIGKLRKNIIKDLLTQYPMEFFMEQQNYGILRKKLDVNELCSNYCI